MKRPTVYILWVVLFFVAVILRLYRITAPVADWHSWRQADTAAVARHFETSGIDVLHPQYDDLSNIQSGKDNLKGWRMVEMPLYQAAGVIVHRVFPGITIETALRFVSITATAGSALLLALLFNWLIGPTVSVIGMFVYATLPYSIYYGRSILPDTFATFWAMLCLVLLASPSERLWTLRVLLAGLCAAVGLLVRPMEVFMLLPSVFFIFERKGSVQKLLALGMFGALSVAPLLLWRKWISGFPEGIPVSDWLYNKGDIRFKGAWFYWLFARRLAELILGYWGLVPFASGLMKKFQTRAGIFSFLWLTGALLYFIIFAGGNVQHDYYQALIIPVVVWFFAIGIEILWTEKAGFNTVASRSLAVLSIVFMWMFSWYTIRTYFWINRPEIVEAGRDADARIPKNAKVIAPYNGDTTFLYQIRRQGWPLGFDIDKKIAMGAQYYVTVSPTDNDTETRDLAKAYTVIVRNDRYAIIDLTRPNTPVK